MLINLIREIKVLEIRMKKNTIKNIIKLFFALSIGGVLGSKLLTTGDPINILLCFACCGLGGFILSKIGSDEKLT